MVLIGRSRSRLLVRELLSLWFGTLRFAGDRAKMETPEISLTDQEISLVQSTWATLMENEVDTGTAILIKYFTDYPDRLNLFSFRDIPLDQLKDSPKFKTHASLVMRSIDKQIKNLKDPKTVKNNLENIGKIHSIREGVKGEYFLELESVILEILEQAVSKQAYNAWRKFLDQMMLTIIKYFEIHSKEK